MNEAILGYAAALVDGEGNIRIAKRWDGDRATYYPAVIVSNTERSLLTLLKQNWAGSIYLQRKADPKHRAIYQWRVIRTKAKGFIRDIEPYLIAKKAQAKLLLAFPGRGNPSQKEDIYKKIKLLNKRGPRTEQLKMELKSDGQLSLF